MKYILLERVFERFTEDDDLEALIARSTYVGMPRISWAKIHKHRFAIVLGEAGSGKTREFQAQAQHLKEKGRIAFFVRAEDLVAQTLEDAIDPEDAAQLDAWKRGMQKLSSWSTRWTRRKSLTTRRRLRSLYEG